MKKITAIIAVIVIIIICLNILFFVAARYGWRLYGFAHCITPTAIYADEIIVTDDSVSLKGSTSHSAPAYVGYVHEVKDGKLYVGLKYNTLFGFSERDGAFDIQIKLDTADLSAIYFKNGKEEEVIWENPPTETNLKVF